MEAARGETGGRSARQPAKARRLPKRDEEGGVSFRTGRVRLRVEGTFALQSPNNDGPGCEVVVVVVVVTE